MTLIYAFVIIFVVVFVAGCIEAVHINKKMKTCDEKVDETPSVIIGQKVPDPFESFRKEK